MLRSKQPNRFFGVNPQGMPNQGAREGAWSRDVPKDWRSALGLEPEADDAPAPAEEPAVTADAEAEGAAA